MKTKKELLQKLNDLNVNPFLQARANRLSVKDLQKLIELKEQQNKKNIYEKINELQTYFKLL